MEAIMMEAINSARQMAVYAPATHPAESAAPESHEPEPEKAVRRERDEYVPSGRCTVNTDRVDAEIRRLKQKKAELERQLQSGGDPAVEAELRKIEEELRQKDTDTYRRQHAVRSGG